MDVRETALAAIEEGQATRGLFEVAQNHALSLLRDCIFPLFKSSSEFRLALKRSGCADLQELASRERKSPLEEMTVEDVRQVLGQEG